MRLLKNNFLIPILFMIAATHIGFTHSAEKSTSWLDILDGVISGDIPIRSLFSSEPRKSESFELVPFSELPLKKIPFTDLPQELQNKIIGYLSMAIDDSDIVASATAISSLAKVNKELNKKINNPEFTEKLIRNFYEKFAGTSFQLPYTFQYNHFIINKGTKMDIPHNDKNLGYQSVAILLKTQGALKWLQNQETFQKKVAEKQREHDEYYENLKALDPWR